MEIVYFTLLCSVLIFVHELGHFFWAKIFGVKIVTFSIGFGPKILRFRGRETEYCIALFPFGGFVKMLEENGQEEIFPEDRQRTFDAQPIWKRLIIILAGPMMNVIFPIVLYFVVFAGEQRSIPALVGSVLPGHPADGRLQPGDIVLEIDGDRITTFSELHEIVSANPQKQLAFHVFRNNQYVDVVIIPEKKSIQKPFELVETVGEIGIRPYRIASAIGVAKPDSPAYRAGLRTFDLITEIRGKAIRSYADLEQIIHDNRGETVPVTYLRPTDVSSVFNGFADMAVYESGVAALTPNSTAGDATERTGIEPVDLFVASVPEGSSEWKAGLRVGDRITSVDDRDVSAWSVLVDRMYAAPDREHTVTWLRGGQRKSGHITLRREEWTNEYGEKTPRFRLRATNWVPVVTEPYVENPSAIRYAFIHALRETYDTCRFIGVGLVRMIQGKVSLSTLGGPLSVYDVIGQESAKGISYFIWVMAVISINLGLINLFPIPVLDGGHLLFLAIEMIGRRRVSLRVRELASLAGMIFLIVIMIFAFKNDLSRRDAIQSELKDLVTQ